MSNDDLTKDKNIEYEENNYFEKSKPDQKKLDARRKLEEYMENKRLRELIEF